MPKYRYDGDERRYYTNLPVAEVNPGDIIELEDDPGDGRWTQVSDRRKTTEEKEKES
jgi:adenylate kinase